VTDDVPETDEPEITRGILDTSTVILLPRLTDAARLPIEPLITTVTLAELSVGPLVALRTSRSAPRARRTSSRPRPTSIRFPSMLLRPAPSAVLQRRCAVPAARALLAAMTQ
jgi:hypothetical protein